MNLTRRKLGLVVLVAVVVSSVATAVASALIRSPAEVAARTAPPEPTPILVAADERVISVKVVSRGTGRFGSPEEITLTRSALKTGPQVVTSLPDPGAELGEGAELLTVSGRPVFLLGGERPSYRDIGPGVRGPDVEQLEAALDRLGLRPGTVDDRYDVATGRAVRELYRRAGFEPMMATAPQLDAVRPVEAGLVAGGRAASGIQLPADEVVFVPTPQVRVTEVKAGLGAEPSGSLLTVTDAEVAVDGALTREEAQLVKPGMPVTIDEPALGITAGGTVQSVADQPGTDGADGFHVFFSTAVADPPPTLVGSSVRLTIAVTSTSKAVLAVPISAVSLAPDGSPRVQRSVNGRLEFLPVTPGVSGDGYVAVVGGALAPGDLVVIGVEAGGARGGG
jgi:peptidoglycan hydrolase-like protein with peptidoglycan-binding domain